MMLAWTLLLGGAAVAEATRLVPESANVLQHGAGAHGAGSFGVFPVPVQTLSALHAARDEELREAPVITTPRPFGPETLIAYAGRTFQDMEPVRGEMSDKSRIKDRGGAPTEYWKVDRKSKEPKLVKSLRLNNEQDRFAAKNELKAIMKMDRESVFLSLVETYTQTAEGVDKEIVIMTEDFAGTLNTLITKYKGKLDVLTMLDLFLEIVDQLDQLRRKGIAHDSPTTEDVLIAGDLERLDECHIVLCSSIANTDIRVCSKRAALGRLLTFRRPRDPRARMRTKQEVMEADLKSLDTIFVSLVDLVMNSEVVPFLAITLELKLKDMSADGTVEQVYEHIDKVRKEWIIRNSLEQAAETHEQSETGDFAGAIFKPKGVKGDDELTEEIMKSIGQLDQPEIEAKAIEVLEGAEVAEKLEEKDKEKKTEAMSESVADEDSAPNSEVKTVEDSTSKSEAKEVEDSTLKSEAKKVEDSAAKVEAKKVEQKPWTWATFDDFLCDMLGDTLSKDLGIRRSTEK